MTSRAASDPHEAADNPVRHPKRGRIAAPTLASLTVKKVMETVNPVFGNNLRRSRGGLIKTHW